jgi:Prokaryotic Cytochrome C oxidase subunit IV
MILPHPTRIWMLLVVATLVGFALAEGEAAPRIATTAIILIAAFKIHLIIGHFMELKWLPRPFRLILSGWLALVSTIIIGGTWAA